MFILQRPWFGASFSMSTLEPFVRRLGHGPRTIPAWLSPTGNLPRFGMPTFRRARSRRSVRQPSRRGGHALWRSSIRYLDASRRGARPLSQTPWLRCTQNGTPSQERCLIRFSKNSLTNHIAKRGRFSTRREDFLKEALGNRRPLTDIIHLRPPFPKPPRHFPSSLGPGHARKPPGFPAPRSRAARSPPPLAQSRP